MEHELVIIARGRKREQLVDAAHAQEWIGTAPAVMVIAAAFERTTIKYGSRGNSYVYLEAGHAAESLMQQVVALGLASTIIGAFDENEVRQLLHLAPSEAPLCRLPVETP